MAELSHQQLAPEETGEVWGAKAAVTLKRGRVKESGRPKGGTNRNTGEGWKYRENETECARVIRGAGLPKHDLSN